MKQLTETITRRAARISDRLKAMPISTVNPDGTVTGPPMELDSEQERTACLNACRSGKFTVTTRKQDGKLLAWRTG